MIRDGRNVLVIAGPCSAESPMQLMHTAEELIKHVQPDVFRAGIWKARTRKGAFEGAGEIALQWLQEVKKQYGLQLATEVLTPKHVELCLRAEIDFLWIGARTVVNPFAVNEICQALNGTKVNVMVKNPVNPDVSLWAGAIERVQAARIQKIYAIHRGFSTFYKSPYRNMPLWEIPNELKRIFPHIPVLCDPSHICGKTQCIDQVMQHALDLEMDGFMIESHVNPLSAKSDKDQQLKPVELNTILQQLIYRRIDNQETKKLINLRNNIDAVDDQLLELLAKRMEIVHDIGDHKKKYGITILQSDRSRMLFNDRMEKGKDLHLNNDFIKDILRVIHNEAIRIQQEILNEQPTKRNKCN